MAVRKFEMKFSSSESEGNIPSVIVSKGIRQIVECSFDDYFDTLRSRNIGEDNFVILSDDIRMLLELSHDKEYMYVTVYIDAPDDAVFLYDVICPECWNIVRKTQWSDCKYEVCQPCLCCDTISGLR